MQRASRRLGIPQVEHVDTLLGYGDVLASPDSSCQMTGRGARGKAAVSAAVEETCSATRRGKRKTCSTNEFESRCCSVARLTKGINILRRDRNVVTYRSERSTRSSKKHYVCT